MLRNIHTYPNSDTEVITEYFFDLDHWVPLSRTTLISDDLGRLVDAFAMIYDEATGTYLPDSRILFYPYENSLTEADSFFVFGWAPELKDWHRLLAVWNRFDASGQLKESLSSTELFEFPIVFLDRFSTIMMGTSPGSNRLILMGMKNIQLPVRISGILITCYNLQYWSSQMDSMDL